MKCSSALLCLIVLGFAALEADASSIQRRLLTGGVQSIGVRQSAAPERTPRARTDGWFAEDKADHFFTSAMLGCSAFVALRATRNDEATAFVSSLTGTLTIGIGKEIWDVFHPGTPSWKDLTADLLGTMLGIASAHLMTAR